MSKFQLINNLNESKIIRNKSNLSNISMQDVVDTTFLYFITLDILSRSSAHKDFVRKYTHDTLKFGDRFDQYRTGGNDLYVLMHLVLSDSSRSGLKDFEKSAKLVKNMDPDKASMVHFIKGLKHDRNIPRGQINRFFLKFESELLVVDPSIRALRRLARDWDDDKSQGIQRQVVTTLVNLYKPKLRYSELFRELQVFAKSVKEPEKIKEAAFHTISSRMNEAEGSTAIMSPKVVDAFVRLGDRQRGKPENAMLVVQKASAGGVVPYAVEHIGDLSHRMTHGLKYGNDGYDTVKPKVEKCLRTMTNSYGFRREHEENVISNAKFSGMDPDVMNKKIDDALTTYGREHSLLPSYNEAQHMANMAAMSFGDKKWDVTVQCLRALAAMLVTPEKWREEATKNVVDKYGDPIPFDHWPVTETIKESSYADYGFETFNIDRAEMPQIRKNKDKEFLQYLTDNGIAFDMVDVPASSLNPTQAEFNPDRLSTPSKNDRPIIISQDDYILDGHHRWTSAWKHDATSYINVIRVYLNINDLFTTVTDFDGAVFKELDEGQITETLDSPYPYKWTQWYEKNKTARFQTNHGGHINVIFVDTGAQSWDISFYDEESLSDAATGKGDEFKIFSTVVAIIRDWWADQLDKHPIDRPYEIAFSASKDKSAKSRTALYSRFIKQFAKETRMVASMLDSDKETVFILKRRKKKPKRVSTNEAAVGMTPEARHEILNSYWSADKGLKAGRKARFWRGVNPESGGGMATYGTGLYITGSRSYAKQFAGDGRVIEMDRYDLPQNPFRFRTVNDYEIWLQRAYGAMGFSGPREFNAAYGDIRNAIHDIDPDVDGIQISTGKDAMFVNYHGRKVFEDGRIVKGVNTTADVDTDAVKKEASKWGWIVSDDGYPSETST